MEEVVALKHYGIGKAVNETLVTYVALVEAVVSGGGGGGEGEMKIGNKFCWGLMALTHEVSYGVLHLLPGANLEKQ